MHLPFHTHAMAIVIALSTTASIIVTLAEIGHPPPDGRGVLEAVLSPMSAQQQGLASVTRETRFDAAALQPKSREAQPAAYQRTE